MADRIFTANVVMAHPDTYAPVVFLIGDEVPEWAIVGDHVCTSEGTTQLVQTADDDTTGDESGDEQTPGADDDKTEVDDDKTEVDEEDEIPPYDEWSKTDLRAEVDGRELDVPAKANIADLVAALQADDAANAETE